MVCHPQRRAGGVVGPSRVRPQMGGESWGHVQHKVQWGPVLVVVQASEQRSDAGLACS